MSCPWTLEFVYFFLGYFTCSLKIVSREYKCTPHIYFFTQLCVKQVFTEYNTLDRIPPAQSLPSSRETGGRCRLWHCGAACAGRSDGSLPSACDGSFPICDAVAVFFFISFISLTLISSRSLQVVPNGKIHSFYGWIIPLCVCICMYIYMYICDGIYIYTHGGILFSHKKNIHTHLIYPFMYS